MGGYCRQHAGDNMVHICIERCVHDFFTKRASFNLEGSTTTAYYKQHAEDEMMSVLNKRWSHDSCTRRPNSVSYTHLTLPTIYSV